jgi:hypothetical protein
MSELPTLDMAVVGDVKRLMDNIKDDVDQYNSMEQIADLVDEHKLTENKAYKTLLQSVCALLREKGYPQTADLFLEHWHI